MFNSLEKIRLLGDPVLKTQCGDIVEFDKSIENLAAKMLKVLKKDSTGIGLAANQIGVKKRIVIVDTDCGLMKKVVFRFQVSITQL